MSNSKSSVILRIAAGFVGLMLLVIVLLSTLFIAAEADHDCPGEDCPVCICIQMCKNTLRSFSNWTAALFVFVITAVFVMLTSDTLVSAAFLDALVSKKVRLNN